MEELKYIIEDSTIAQLLGVQNFTSKESAVLELVKNAFDAKADKLLIQISKNEITFTDNGDGMSEDDIRENWMHIGKSNKRYNVKDKKGNDRVLAGSKGIGRFALARLGENVEVQSYKQDSLPISWKTDWNTSQISNQVNISDVGTTIRIDNLRDKWTEKAIVNLSDYLSRAYNDSLMEIRVVGFEKKLFATQYFGEPRLGFNCTSMLNLEYDSKNCILNVHVSSDEFDEKSKKYYKGNIQSYDQKIDVLDAIDKSNLEVDTSIIEPVLHSLGNFTSQLYFSLNNSKANQEKFLYKRLELQEKYDEGIILYRNSFSISSYEGKSDWLGLGSRSRKSPAAATHPTGAWRVRENQMSGKVLIDKERNKNLRDLSNRQGLDKNLHYDMFVQIIQIALKEFEYYRQSIIRSINKKNKEPGKSKPRIIDSIIKNPKKISNMSETNVKEFVDELKDLKEERKEFRREITSTEKRYKYDIRILNVLATLGLKASSIAHEMKNDRNSIRDNKKYIIDALNDMGLWETISSPENTRFIHSDVPSLLEKNQKVNDRIVRFMNIMLDEIRKERFESQRVQVSSLVLQIVNLWEQDYSWISIQKSIEEGIEFHIPEDLVGVILDNLILNSIQQNEEFNELSINLKIFTKKNKLYIEYQDNGKGLPDKYKENPNRILEVHETSKENGHGLGMWIVNNSINFTKGKIENIEGDNGFGIKFYLGGE